MKHLFPLALVLCLLSSAHGQWVLDGDWSGDGRKVEASDRWECPYPSPWLRVKSCC